MKTIFIKSCHNTAKIQAYFLFIYFTFNFVVKCEMILNCSIYILYIELSYIEKLKPFNHGH